MSAPALARCDYAACREPAVTSAGGWNFCGPHANEDAKLRSAEDAFGDDVEAPVTGPRALHDIDPIAVELAVNGERPGRLLNRGERLEAVRRLHAQQLADRVIASRLHIHDRQVLRDRQSLCLPAIPLDRRITMHEIGPEPRSVASPIAKLLEDASSHERVAVRRLGERIEADLDRLRGLLAEDKQKEKARAEVARLEAELAEAKARLRGKPTTAPAKPTAGPKTCVGCGEEVVRKPGQRGMLPSRCDTCKAAA